MPYLKQICNDRTSCASYILGCPTSGECVVVDPKEDVTDYVEVARAKGTRIIGIVETHVHADHVSGARNLGKVARAPIFIHKSADVKFDHVPLRDNELIDFGNARIKVMSTPGHTPESVSLLYIDRTRSRSPWAVLTGDTLFVGDVGRLDLYGAGTPEQMYDSIFNKLLSMDDYVEVYPAHYAGSVCGKGMSPKTISTIGFERRFNPALKARSKRELARYLKANAPKPFPEARTIKNKNAGYR
jgi:hydroxyacylglutathione hydrolase